MQYLRTFLFVCIILQFSALSLQANNDEVVKEKTSIQLFNMHNNALQVSVDGMENSIIVRKERLIKGFEIQVINYDGDVLMEEKFSSFEIIKNNISIDHLEKGAYFLLVKTSEGTLYKKFNVHSKDLSNI